MQDSLQHGNTCLHSSAAACLVLGMPAGALDRMLRKSMTECQILHVSLIGKQDRQLEASVAKLAIAEQWCIAAAHTGA